MRISKSLVKYLLGYVVAGYFTDHSDPPADPEGYAEVAQSLHRYASANGSLEWLHLAIGHLLATPDIDLQEYATDHYPIGQSAMRTLLEYLWQTYWPEEPIPEPEEGPPVEIAELTDAEWAAEIAAQTGL
jgi:hypothetical protein